MAFFPIPLYGDDSRGYTALMGHYASYAAYRFTYIHNYFNMELPPYEDEDDLGPFADPPWKRPKTHFDPETPLVAGDDISILLYLPIHRSETLSVHAEMVHVKPDELKLIAANSLVVYTGSDNSEFAFDPVHYSISDEDIWRHARIEFTAAAAVAVGEGVENLHAYLMAQPDNTYYLFRIRIESSHSESTFHREENGFLMVGPVP